MNPLPEFIEDGETTLDERAPIHGRLDAARGAIQQADAKFALDVCNRLGHRRLRHCKLAGGFCHDAALRDRKQDVKIPQLEATPNTLVPLHRRTLTKPVMRRLRLTISKLYPTTILLRHHALVEVPMMSARWTRSFVLTFALTAALIGVLGFHCPEPAFGQSYPSRTVTVVVPFPAG